MKTNEQFARKCISNLPRLRDRNFRIILTVKRTVRVIDIKPSLESQLKIFFDRFQWFLIDNDLLATPVMGVDGDLFITFDRFQFHVGNYAHVSPVDFLEAVIGEFYHDSVCESSLFSSRPPTNQKDPDIITSKLQMPMRHLINGGLADMLVRRYVPGPKGFNDKGTYHTLPWSGFSNVPKEGIEFSELANDPQLVVVMMPDKSIQPKPTDGDIDVRYALTIAEFMEYAELKKLDISTVSFHGWFTVRRKVR